MGYEDDYLKDSARKAVALITLARSEYEITVSDIWDILDGTDDEVAQTVCALAGIVLGMAEVAYPGQSAEVIQQLALNVDRLKPRFIRD